MYVYAPEDFSIWLLMNIVQYSSLCITYCRYWAPLPASLTPSVGTSITSTATSPQWMTSWGQISWMNLAMNWISSERGQRTQGNHCGWEGRGNIYFSNFALNGRLQMKQIFMYNVQGICQYELQYYLWLCLTIPVQLLAVAFPVCLIDTWQDSFGSTSWV